MKKLTKTLINLIPTLVVIGVGLICAIFLILGSPSDDGSITLDGKPAEISDSTKAWIESAKEALERIVNTPATDAETIKNYETAESGKGSATTIDEVIGRRLADGNNDNGKGWQCSRYTAWLGTGIWQYSAVHPDYGPVNGKDMVNWLVKNYGWKLIDQPVEGAIGSGYFNTMYGHTVMYLYATNGSSAMVNDANWTPLTVSTHEMDITGWLWAVPPTYNPAPAPTPTPDPDPDPDPAPVSACERWFLSKGDTLGKIMLACEGRVEWGDAMNEYAKTWRDEYTGKTVWEGWNTYPYIGLYAGNTIVKVK